MVFDIQVIAGELHDSRMVSCVWVYMVFSVTILSVAACGGNQEQSRVPKFGR